MKKFILVSMIVGIIATGCAQRAVVQTEAAIQKTAPKAVESKPVVAPSTMQFAPKQNIEERELAEMQRLKKELQASLRDIHFNFDKYDLEADAKPVLNNLANILTNHPLLQVIIEGNCDERGTEEYNMALSDRRASTAQQYLISAGIPAARVDTVGYGKDKPICTQSTEECWAKNRRDHFVLDESKH